MVWAIFDPPGDIHVRAVAPSGNEYEVAPRALFRIASEDVDWFFHEWEGQHRACLSHAEEYRPRRPQFDNGEASRVERRNDKPEYPQFDNGEASRDAHVVIEEPDASPSEEPEPEESTEPDPVEAGEGETNEDKE
jgi:hypothetical protein